MTHREEASMELAGGVARDAVETRNHWRGALIGVGVALAAGVLTLLAPQSAQADDDANGLLGSLLGDVTATVTEVTNVVEPVIEPVVAPVVAPLPNVRELPLVGGVVGEVVDSAPVAALTEPITQLADEVLTEGLLGATVASVPIVGELLGDEPVGSLLGPVSGVVDGALGGIVGARPDAPDAAPALQSQPTASAELWFGQATVGFATQLLTDSRIADQVVAIAAGAGGPIHGPVSAPGDIAPASAVTASGPPIGLAAAVLGAGLLFLLATGRVRPLGFRAPPSPVYATDSSPD